MYDRYCQVSTMIFGRHGKVDLCFDLRTKIVPHLWNILLFFTIKIFEKSSVSVNLHLHSLSWLQHWSTDSVVTEIMFDVLDEEGTDMRSFPFII
jgi:hypothetical protein